MSHSLLARSTVLAALAFAVACGGNDAAQQAGGGADSVATVIGDTSAGVDSAGAAGAMAAAMPGGETASGAELYTRCVTCHQANGEGMAGAFPPLTGSEWVTGNPAVPIRVVLHGVQGPITVKGQQYNSMMLPYGTGQPMSDAEVAAVLTHVRASFGNNASPVTAAQVATERAATSSRTTPWTAGDLAGMLK